MLTAIPSRDVIDHHFDSYPTALGRTLWGLYHSHFAGDLPSMLSVLLDEHPAGWSTINNADWRLPAGIRDRDSEPCAVCGGENWRHYTQYYPAHGLAQPPRRYGTYQALDHDYQYPEQPHGPECYCHGSRQESEQVITERNAADVGCEWVYVFDERNRQMTVLSSFNGDGTKMIGLFGSGNPGAKWRVVGSYSLDGPEPNWATME